MGQLIGEILSFAIGVAVSPVPIAAAIVILFTPKARTNAPMFMTGWVLGLLVVASIVLLVPGLGDSSGEPTTTTGVIKGIMGLLLLIVAVGEWRKRPGPGETADPPKWMDSLDAFGAGKSLAMGFVLSALNPKNLLLTAAAAVAIAASGLPGGEQIVVLVVFIAIAASTVVIPVVGYLIAGDRSDDVLKSAKDWLIQNNSAVMGVLLLVFGFSLIGDAIAILL